MDTAQLETGFDLPDLPPADEFLRTSVGENATADDVRALCARVSSLREFASGRLRTLPAVPSISAVANDVKSTAEGLGENTEEAFDDDDDDADREPRELLLRLARFDTALRFLARLRDGRDVSRAIATDPDAGVAAFLRAANAARELEESGGRGLRCHGQLVAALASHTASLLSVATVRVKEALENLGWPQPIDDDPGDIDWHTTSRDTPNGPGNDRAVTVPTSNNDKGKSTTANTNTNFSNSNSNGGNGNDGKKCDESTSALDAPRASSPATATNGHGDQEHRSDNGDGRRSIALSELVTAFRALVSLEYSLGRDAPISAVDVLVEPLRRRFAFHFSGDRPTNRPERPEWAMAHVLGWVRAHAGFVRRLETAVTGGSGLTASPRLLASFVRALSQTLNDKLASSLPFLMGKPEVLQRAVAGAAGFEIGVEQVTGVRLDDSPLADVDPEMEMGSQTENARSENGGAIEGSDGDEGFDAVTGYGPEIKGPLAQLFSHPPFLDAWIEAEEETVRERWEKVLSGPAAWEEAFVEPRIVDEPGHLDFVTGAGVDEFIGGWSDDDENDDGNDDENDDGNDCGDSYGRSGDDSEDNVPPLFPAAHPPSPRAPVIAVELLSIADSLCTRMEAVPSTRARVALMTRVLLPLLGNFHDLLIGEAASFPPPHPPLSVLVSLANAGGWVLSGLEDWGDEGLILTVGLAMGNENEGSEGAIANPIAIEDDVPVPPFSRVTVPLTAFVGRTLSAMVSVIMRSVEAAGVAWIESPAREMQPSSSQASIANLSPSETLAAPLHPLAKGLATISQSLSHPELVRAVTGVLSGVAEWVVDGRVAAGGSGKGWDRGGGMKLGVDLRVIRGVFGDTLDEIAAAARGSGSPKRRKRVAEYLGNLVDRKFARADDAAAVLSMRAQDARSLRDRLNTALESAPRKSAAAPIARTAMTLFGGARDLIAGIGRRAGETIVNRRRLALDVKKGGEGSQDGAGPRSESEFRAETENEQENEQDNEEEEEEDTVDDRDPPEVVSILVRSGINALSAREVLAVIRRRVDIGTKH